MVDLSSETASPEGTHNAIKEQELCRQGERFGARTPNLTPNTRASRALESLGHALVELLSPLMFPAPMFQSQIPYCRPLVFSLPHVAVAPWPPKQVPAWRDDTRGVLVVGSV